MIIALIISVVCFFLGYRLLKNKEMASKKAAKILFLIGALPVTLLIYLYINIRLYGV
jgi:hypothetical protein